MAKCTDPKVIQKVYNDKKLSNNEVIEALGYDSINQLNDAIRRNAGLSSVKKTLQRSASIDPSGKKDTKAEAKPAKKDEKKATSKKDTKAPEQNNEENNGEADSGADFAVTVEYNTGGRTERKVVNADSAEEIFQGLGSLKTKYNLPNAIVTNKATGRTITSSAEITSGMVLVMKQTITGGSR